MWKPSTCSCQFYQKLNLLWKDYFQNSWLWYDNRNMKYSPTSPDFRQRMTKDCLWIDGLYNPSWVITELTRKETSMPTHTEFSINNDSIGTEISIASELNHNHDIAFVEMVKCCTKHKDLHKGKIIHDEIARRGLLEKSPYIASALINMYAKCGILTKAKEVFDELSCPDIVSWSALIGGYTQQGKGHEAMIYFDRMICNGLSPNAVTYASILKACSQTRDIKKGKQIHDEIVKRGFLEKNLVLGSALVDMYAKCAMLAKAQEVLDELVVRDVVTWNALISGYAQNKRGHEALDCFDRMRNEGLSPDLVTFTCILNACGSTRSIVKGKAFHEEIVMIGGLLQKSVILGNALVDMYAKCCFLAKAREVLYELPIRDAVSWNAVIVGYVQQGQGEEALKCFEQMRKEGLSGDLVTFLSILKACASTRAIKKGMEMHDEIVGSGLLDKNSLLGTALVDMYAKFGMLEKAQEILNELPVQDVASLSAIIAEYSQQGQGPEALNICQRMQTKGMSPDAITFVCMLKACGSTEAIEKGMQIHNEIVSRGLLGQNIVLGNALVDMYAKCGMLAKAQELLDELPVRDTVSWNALIAGYAQQGQGHKALDCFEQMQREGLCPDIVTFVCILKASVCTRDLDKGRRIHDEITRKGMMGKNIVLDNALIDMYAKCGMLDNAQKLLNELPGRDVVSWNSVIAGYAHEGQGHEALKCFGQMRNEGFSPDAITFASMFKACGSIGAIHKGKQIHDEVVNEGLLEKDIVLGTALVDMYAKCGVPAKAHQILLDGLPRQTVASWNAVISGYAQQGQGHEAVECFEQVCRMKGLLPDSVTFLCLLNACSHSGLVDEFEMYFGLMSSKFGIIPSLEHYTCMVDAFGCAGLFSKAISVVEKESCSDYPPVWLSILSACRKWGNVQLGRYAFDQAVRLDCSYGVYYVIMANIYATAGMQQDADKVEAMRVQFASWKKPEHSLWFDTNGNAHSFSIGRTNHCQSKEIYRRLEDIDLKLSNEGCSQSVLRSLKSVSNSVENNVLCGHTHLVAMACALINTHREKTIHVVSNVHICADCHTGTKLISKLEHRKIMVRDAGRLHVFQDGKCSCGDCW